MKKIILSLLAIALLPACSHTLTQKEKDDFLAEQSGVAFGSLKILPSSTRTKIPLKAGQWAVVATELKDASGNVTALAYAKHKIVSLKGDTLTMEIESRHAGRPETTVMAFVVDHFPVGKQLSWTKDELDAFLGRVEFKRIVTKVGNGNPSELPLNFVPLTKTYLRNLFLSGYRHGDVITEACATEVLSSRQCLAYDYVVDLPGFSDTGRVEAHSAVPVVGFISQKSGRSESKVIAFGLKGAKGLLIE
jgi:hypothetical protein